MCRPDNRHRRRRRPPRPHRPFPERGWVQFLLLRLLDEDPMHGYQLMEELEVRDYVRSGRFETGSIYTILNRMEERGLLSSTKSESETGRMRRVYDVTESGREVLKRGLESIIQRKKMMDELTEYYEERFRGSDRGDTSDEKEPRRGEKIDE
jgi:DNA-binding PadR family transcriptional regulator